MPCVLGGGVKIKVALGPRCLRVACKGALPTSVDLVGGYYDSGDHVKFGLPMAYVLTMLSWSCVEFEKEIYASNQLQSTLDAIKWGTNYFIKAHTEPNILWAKEGDGDSDHYCWERVEDMSNVRMSCKISSNKSGSDLAGDTSAGMTATFIAFKAYDSKYSQLLLSHAKQMTYNDVFFIYCSNNMPSYTFRAI